MNLQQRAEELRSQMVALLDAAEAEGRGLTEEERQKYDAWSEERAGIVSLIEAREALKADEKRERQPQRSEGPEASAIEERADSSVRMGEDREADRDFASLGEQLRAVARFEQSNGTDIDRRLLRIREEQRNDGINSNVAAEGGFLVDQPLANGIERRMFETGQILQRVSQRPIGAGSNGIRYNVLKENSRADGSRNGGVQGYWTAEAGDISISRMNYEERELRLQKVAAAVPATEEMLNDVAFLEAEISDLVPSELVFQTEAAIVAGNGAGKPLGFKEVDAYIAIAKESGQAADSVVGENVVKQMARMPASSFANAVWLCDQSVTSQLPLLKVGDNPVWQPNWQESPFGALLGRPIIPVEHLSPVGDQGDIILADLAQYRLITKGGVDAAASMHVRFLTDEMVFRFTYRVDGHPLYRQALTPKSGGDTLSPFVSIAARD